MPAIDAEISTGLFHGSLINTSRTRLPLSAKAEAFWTNDEVGRSGSISWRISDVIVTEQRTPPSTVGEARTMDCPGTMAAVIILRTRLNYQAGSDALREACHVPEYQDAAQFPTPSY